MRLWPQREPRLLLGTAGPFFFRRSIGLTRSELMQHGHIIGTSGSGKSRFLAQFCVSLLKLGLPVTLLDPHGELARLVLAMLVEGGFYTRPETFDRILYLDLAAAEQKNLYLPFNVLAQPGHSDTVASNVKEAFHRTFPELGDVAATFDTLLPDAVELLVHNQLPLTKLHRLLVDGRFRETLLAQERDPDLVSSFRDIYEQLKKSDQVTYAGSVLRRARQLTRTRILKYGLAQPSMLLDFHQVLARHQAVIVNLAVENRDARRFLGSLLTVGVEQAAKARGTLPPGARYSSMHLLIDEFQLFSSKDADQFTDMLSETRKFRVFLWMAHQTVGQMSERLRSAVQNAGVEVVFGLDREDSEYAARKIGRVNLEQVKHVVEDEQAEARTHPVFTSAAEQWERWTQSIQDLPVSEAFVTLKRREMPRPFRLQRVGTRTRLVRMMRVTRPELDVQVLAAVEREYLRRYFTPQAEVERHLSALRLRDVDGAPERSRMEVLEDVA
jgi:Helicase HerA, central domain/TraM recognition site of TraD and TraG